MKNYLGTAIISFDIDAYSKADLVTHINKQLGTDLTLEDVNIETVYGDGYDPFDEADRINDEKKTFAH